MEIILTLLYAMLIGFYDIFKKLSLKKSTNSVILVMFTSVAFLLSLIWIPSGVAVPFKYILIFALKGFLLALSWFLVLKVLKTANLSIVAITNILSSVLSFVLGIVIFNESAGILQIIGSAIIVCSVALMNLLNKKEKNKITKLQLLMLLVSALITTSSNVIDKFTTTHLSNHQVQFWFLLFVALFSWIFFIIECIKNKHFLIEKKDIKNFWIYLVGILLFVGDILLFSAYKVPGSQMITISILSKMKVVVSVSIGILVFKEKNAFKKLILTAFVLLGVILIAL